MSTIKTYTDLVQSKKLAEFLPLESADMGYLWNGTSFCEWPVSNQTIFKRIENIPCWSLAALFVGVLPKFIGDYSKCLYYDVDGCYCGYMNDGDFMLKIKETKASNPVDACVKMIERLHDLNLL